MLGRDLFVKLYAQAGFGGRDDVPVLPLDGFLDDFGVEAVESLDALLNQEVGTARGYLDVGRSLQRAAVQVRGDLGVMGLGHACDLLGLQDAADPGQRRLDAA